MAGIVGTYYQLKKAHAEGDTDDPLAKELDAKLDDITDPNHPYLDIACAELCGHSHHLMRAQLRILEEPKYHEWLKMQNALLQDYFEVEDGKVVYYEFDWPKWDSSDRTRVTKEDLDLLKSGHKHGEEEEDE